jgi:hypothetical protein
MSKAELRSTARPSVDESATTPQYSVGYKRPPKQHRFPKGISGNVKGRPKAIERNLLDDLRDLLDEEISLSNGTRMSKAEGFIRKIVGQAMKGDQKAFGKFIRLAHEAGLLRDLRPQTRSNVTYVVVGPEPKKPGDKDDEA